MKVEYGVISDDTALRYSGRILTSESYMMHYWKGQAVLLSILILLNKPYIYHHYEPSDKIALTLQIRL